MLTTTTRASLGVLAAMPGAGRADLDAHHAADDDELALDDPRARRSRRPGSRRRPGVSIRLIFRPCHSQWASEAESDICRRCSSSSQSETVVPCSTVPSRLIGSGLEEQRLDQGRLPRPAVADDGDVADLSGLLSGHARGFLPVSVVVADLIDARAGRPAEGRSRSRGYSRAGAGGGRAGQPRLQAEDRLRVQLRDAGLGHAEHLADLAQGQLLVVVERDHELLALGQPCDRLAERLAQLGLVERLRRLRARTCPRSCRSARPGRRCPTRPSRARRARRSRSARCR